MSSGRFTELWNKPHSPKSRASGKVQNPWVPISRPQWGPPTPKCMRTSHVFVLPDIAWDWSRGSLTVVTAAHLSFPAGAQRQVWPCSQSRKVGLRAVVVTCCHQPNVDKNQVNLWGLGGERSVQSRASGVLALSWKTNRPWQLCRLFLPALDAVRSAVECILVSSMQHRESLIRVLAHGFVLFFIHDASFQNQALIYSLTKQIQCLLIIFPVS